MKLIKPDEGWENQCADFGGVATLDDLKAALKEFGMVAVPVEPTDEIVDAPWVALGDGKHSIRDIYKSMVKAAEGRDNG